MHRCEDLQMTAQPADHSVFCVTIRCGYTRPGCNVSKSRDYCDTEQANYGVCYFSVKLLHCTECMSRVTTAEMCSRNGGTLM
jgi:hypothetical protein